MDIILSQESIWSFTAVDFLGFEFFPVKSETPKFSATLTPESFTVIVSIASTTRKFVKDDRAQAVRHFNFEQEIVENTCS